MLFQNLPETNFILKQKIEDMISYGKQVVDNFPNRERMIADEIRSSMIKLYRYAISLECRYEKRTTLRDMDIELNVIRHLVRFAADERNYPTNVPPPIPRKKYEVLSGYLVEIGKILGGYMKYANSVSSRK